MQVLALVLVQHRHRDLQRIYTGDSLPVLVLVLLLDLLLLRRNPFDLRIHHMDRRGLDLDSTNSRELMTMAVVFNPTWERTEQPE